MFGLVIQISGRAEGADEVRAAHVKYSELAADHPGILYKHVMQSREDPARYYDVMVWETQEQSEVFGVDPEYQRHRPAEPPRVPTGWRAWMNPGYSQDVWEIGSTTSNETSQIIGLYEVTPGREQAFEAAAAAARDAVSSRVTSFILYQNLGKPNHYATVIQGMAEADEALLAPLADFTAQPPLVDHGDLIVRYDFR